MNRELAQSLNELQCLCKAVEQCSKEIYELQTKLNNLHRPCVDDYFSAKIQSEEEFIQKNDRYHSANSFLRCTSGPEFEPRFPFWLCAASLAWYANLLVELGSFDAIPLFVELPIRLLAIPGLIVASCLSIWNLVLFLTFGVRYISYAAKRHQNRIIVAEAHNQYERLRQGYERKKAKAVAQFNRDYNRLMDDFEQKQSEIKNAIQEAENERDTAICAFNERSSAIGWPYTLSTPENYEETDYHTVLVRSHPYDCFFNSSMIDELDSVSRLVSSGTADTIDDARHLYYLEKQRQKEIRLKEEESRRREQEKREQEEKARREREEKQQLLEKIARQDELLTSIGSYLIATERQKQEYAREEEERQTNFQNQLEYIQGEMMRKQKKAAENQCYDCERKYRCRHRHENDGHCTAFIPIETHYC